MKKLFLFSVVLLSVVPAYGSIESRVTKAKDEISSMRKDIKNGNKLKINSTCEGQTGCNCCAESN